MSACVKCGYDPEPVDLRCKECGYHRDTPNHEYGCASTKEV